jgi:hypothetical protein
LVSIALVLLIAGVAPGKQKTRLGGGSGLLSVTVRSDGRSLLA